MDHEYLDKKQAAEYLSLSVRTIEGHLHEIKHAYIGRKILFRKSWLDHWMERNVDTSQSNLDEIGEKAKKAVQQLLGNSLE